MRPSSSPPRSRWSAFCVRLALGTFGVLLALVACELVLRQLPVIDGPYRIATSPEAPLYLYEPHQHFTHSLGPLLASPTHGSTNNFGYVHEQNYVWQDPRPLLAVIGDSYVEALRVPFSHSITGQLSALLGEAWRVYSFATSGSPLSQYLAYAAEAQRFGARCIAVVLIANDFDESWYTVRPLPGFHYFDPDGEELVRVDIPQSSRRAAAQWLVRHSALTRYLLYHLRLRWLMRRSVAPTVGQTAADTSAPRMEHARQALERFLTMLPRYAGLPPEQIVIIIDAVRPELYDQRSLAAVRSSFAAQTLHEAAQRALERGYLVRSMEEPFLQHYRRFGARFEHEYDAHWNALGHAVVARSALPLLERACRIEHHDQE